MHELIVTEHPVSLSAYHLRREHSDLLGIACWASNTILILEDNIERIFKEDQYKHHTFVKVAVEGKVGYMNKSYFVSESLWAERIS